MSGMKKKKQKLATGTQCLGEYVMIQAVFINSPIVQYCGVIFVN